LFLEWPANEYQLAEQPKMQKACEHNVLQAFENMIELSAEREGLPVAIRKGRVLRLHHSAGRSWPLYLPVQCRDREQGICQRIEEDGFPSGGRNIVQDCANGSVE
jgi:hypothetical protein